MTAENIMTHIKKVQKLLGWVVGEFLDELVRQSVHVGLVWAEQGRNVKEQSSCNENYSERV